MARLENCTHKLARNRRLLPMRWPYRPQRHTTALLADPFTVVSHNQNRWLWKILRRDYCHKEASLFVCEPHSTRTVFTGDHSKLDQLFLLKIGKYTGCCVYRTSYQVFTMVPRNSCREKQPRKAVRGVLSSLASSCTRYAVDKQAVPRGM